MCRCAIAIVGIASRRWQVGHLFDGHLSVRLHYLIAGRIRPFIRLIFSWKKTEAAV
jgi:hypothetical protein